MTETPDSKQRIKNPSSTGALETGARAAFVPGTLLVAGALYVGLWALVSFVATPEKVDDLAFRNPRSEVWRAFVAGQGASGNCA